MLETATGARSGRDLEDLVEHALRFRNLMAFVQRKYNPAVIEAMALAGSLEHGMTPDERKAALDKAAAWLGRADREAKWKRS
jgi:DNA gyrase subunit B